MGPPGDIIYASSPTNLDPLVGVAHHGDEQVDEDDDGDEEVDEKDELEERDGPVLHVVAQPEVLRAGEAEEAEDQQVEGLRDRHGVTCKIVKCDDATRRQNADQEAVLK